VSATPATPAIPATPGVTPATPAIPATPAARAALIESIKAQIQILIAEIAKLQAGGVSVPPGQIVSAFVKALKVGSRGDDVTNLQTFLKNQGADIYPEGLVTGFYGSLTTRAIERFQVKYGIAGPGDVGYGNFGPKTRAKANELNQ
jgi:hypothetical protein